MFIAHQQCIWVPVNEHGRSLVVKPVTYEEAEKELNQYQFHTNNSGAIFDHNSDDIDWG